MVELLLKNGADPNAQSILATAIKLGILFYYRMNFQHFIYL